MKIVLGAMAPDISKQITDAGFEQIGKKVELLDRLAHAVTLAYLHGCLTESECERARKRIVKQIKVRKIQESA